VTILPESLIVPLQDHLRIVKRTHEDLAKGYGAVYLPYALERKYPNANREWVWQYVFPAGRLSVDPRSGVVRRHHLHARPERSRRESGLQKAIGQAAAYVCRTFACQVPVTEPEVLRVRLEQQ
jgi:hypothetical protein